MSNANEPTPVLLRKPRLLKFEEFPRPKTEIIRPIDSKRSTLTPESIRAQLRLLGVTENILIHEQDYQKFLHERGIKELGSGGEGAVYFLKGHVVKVVNENGTQSALRELAHMLFLNHIVPTHDGRVMGDRARADWPALLWVYVLSNGNLAIGMKPFDCASFSNPGATLENRLKLGPPMDRKTLFGIVRSIARSLAYAHRKDLIHHDLKPANVYIPGDSALAPVVFDLGQSIWRQGAWGREWLKHPHNINNWYNGTYRYMHHTRRLAHLAARMAAADHPITEEQLKQLGNYTPSFYSDVFSFARMLRDIVRSPKMLMTAQDRQTLSNFYRQLMGLADSPPPEGTPVDKKNSSTVMLRLKGLILAPPPAAGPQKISAEQRWPAMPQVLFELEKLLAGLDR